MKIRRNIGLCHPVGCLVEAQGLIHELNTTYHKSCAAFRLSSLGI